MYFFYLTFIYPGNPLRVCFQRRPVWEGTPFTRLQKQIKTSSIIQKIKSSLGTIVSLCSQVILYKCNERYERDKNPERFLSVLLKYCCTDCCLLPSKHTILYGHCGYRPTGAVPHVHLIFHSGFTFALWYIIICLLGKCVKLYIMEQLAQPIVGLKKVHD